MRLSIIPRAAVVLCGSGVPPDVTGRNFVARIVVVPHYSKGMAAGNHLLDDAREPPMAPQRENSVADPAPRRESFLCGRGAKYPQQQRARKARPDFS